MSGDKFALELALSWFFWDVQSVVVQALQLKMSDWTALTHFCLTFHLGEGLMEGTEPPVPSY